MPPREIRAGRLIAAPPPLCREGVREEGERGGETVEGEGVEGGGGVRLTAGIPHKLAGGQDYRNGADLAFFAALSIDLIKLASFGFSFCADSIRRRIASTYLSDGCGASAASLIA